ncbi:helix-turn-helix domain-containing protein [Sphingobium fuliginis]|uniref:LysR family transcriptional regulator n=1 Tax=Sphingobium fuliginis ATCC 27551 TaxID=1208342 RepID=A0A5B8CPF0_SPHSA|nr:LysR family transcriptional regulator [Sphingobium fuliginis]QDC40420.1 LysR family transcriptional regulator [Sphingobium fuliginis ATCC 27551]
MKNVDDLCLFARVAEHESLTAAGRRMAIPKSTLARQIARLEEQLGSPLFHKTARRLVLTNFGERCLDRGISDAVAQVQCALPVLPSSENY